MNIRYFFNVALLLLLSSMVTAQTSDQESNIYKFSVEEDILKLPSEGEGTIMVKSATGHPEDIGQSPISVMTLSSKDIELSGATTLPEALRLFNGLWVQQTTNGNYEVRPRGTGTLPLAGRLNDLKSSSLLVVIDNMPVNDDFQGGICWETLPISLSDIQQIEVIIGPATVLHGPNATSGLINIITKKVENKKINAHAYVQAGSNNSYFNNATLSFGTSDRLKIRLSGRYISTRRFDERTYVFSQQDDIYNDSLLFFQSNVETTNPHIDLAREDRGMNAFLKYHKNDKMSIDLSLSRQNSQVQGLYDDIDELSLIKRKSISNLFNLNASIHNLHLQTSFITGNRNYAVGYGGYWFDIDKINLKVTHDFRLRPLTFTPGINYQSNTYNDRKYSGNKNYENLLKGKAKISSLGLFININMKIMEGKLRWNGGARYEHFEVSNKNIPSYQLAGAYDFSSKWTLKASYTTGNNGNFIYDSYAHGVQAKDNGIQTEIVPNRTLNHTKSRQFSFGINGNMTQMITMDLHYFNHRLTNPIYTATLPTTDENVLALMNRNAPEGYDGTTSGVALSVNALLPGKLKIGAYATLQSPSNNEYQPNSMAPTIPRYIGGLQCNYKALAHKLNINLNTYTYGKHLNQIRRGKSEITPKVITNVKVSYNVLEEHQAFLNIRNLFNDDQQEFIFSDRAPSLYLIGFKLNF